MRVDSRHVRRHDGFESDDGPRRELAYRWDEAVRQVIVSPRRLGTVLQVEVPDHVEGGALPVRGCRLTGESGSQARPRSPIKDGVPCRNDCNRSIDGAQREFGASEMSFRLRRHTFAEAEVCTNRDRFHVRAGDAGGRWTLRIDLIRDSSGTSPRSRSRSENLFTFHGITALTPGSRSVRHSSSVRRGYRDSPTSFLNAGAAIRFTWARAFTRARRNARNSPNHL